MKDHCGQCGMWQEYGHARRLMQYLGACLTLTIMAGVIRATEDATETEDATGRLTEDAVGREAFRKEGSMPQLKLQVVQCNAIQPGASKIFWMAFCDRISLLKTDRSTTNFFARLARGSCVRCQCLLNATSNSRATISYGHPT